MLSTINKLRKRAEALYLHKIDRRTMNYAADELERMDPVMRAWVDAGPAAIYHREMQDKLRREWPTLADALDKATEKRR